MKEYLFILGRDYKLSIIELIAYMQKNNIEYSIKESSETAMVISTNEKFKPETAINHLGGIVKIGKLLENTDEVYEGTANKIKYAISAYGNADVKAINERIKKGFKKQKLKAFYKKPKREKALMPNEVIKQKLIEKGIEFLAYKNYLAKTFAVFNPFEHEKRDKEMPCKDYLKTISIRLAKILINLSQTKNLLVDPFCGYGIILQEAMLQNLNVIGIDIDKKSIESAKKNLKFIEKKYKTKTSHKLIQGDSGQLSKFVKEADGIATEPYLGPYIKQMPSIKEAQKIMTELEDSYKKMLKEAKKVVKGKIAIIVPRFPTKQKKDVTMDFNKILKEEGYKVWQPLKQIKIPIIYPHGKITREIWVIE
ncbi:MAG: hypothetical protein ISS23_03770 [Nanoarchaeota archaeon]|nr:hypothetical protein [Nanoarchaeota archaeon]